MKHKVAIVVPIYNTEKYLSVCIESIMAQTYINLDIILVDDGSTDRSLEICNKYKEQDKRIKVLYQSNQGVLSAKRLGIEKSIYFDDFEQLKKKLDWENIKYAAYGEYDIKQDMPDICFFYLEDTLKK